MDNIKYFELDPYNRDGLDFFIINNCLNPQEMDLLAETFTDLYPKFQPPEFTASSKDEEGNSKNTAKGIFLHEQTPIPSIVDIINRKYATTLHNYLEIKKMPTSVYSNALHTNYISHLLSYHNKDNSKYLPHTDASVITGIMWFHNGETNFTGGELYLPEFDIEIAPIHNTGIIFPSHVQHSVKPINIIDKNRDSGRISYNIFCRYT